MSQPKVVPLSAASKKTSPLPPILHTIRQHSRKQLTRLLESLFNNVDDALFEMADRSRSDADQHMYFESMRELRLQRAQVAKSFAQHYNQGFEAAFSPTDTDAEEEETDFDKVAMVDNDELEIAVAVAGITSKVTSQYSLQIMQLTRRIDHLADGADISERSNPMGPEHLSQAFVTALAGAELDIKVRIILLKLFERFVMERLSSFYSEANQMLIDAGVLPDLKNTLRRERRNPGPAPESDAGLSRGAGSRADARGGMYPSTSYGGREAADGSGGMPGGSAGQSFQVIQELLATSRGSGGTPQPGSGLPGSGTALSTSDVLTALGEAQERLTAPINIEAVPQLLDLRQVVISNAPAGAAAGSSLAQAEDDVVNFVGMLFDYILNDRNLAIPMKALIGRLQLPIVRLAIMDRSFFEKNNHPARQLLNELSSAGIGWSSAKELKRDAVYNKVEAIVLRVMNGFSEDPGIFQELLTDLRSFVSQDSKKRHQVEQRVRDNEKGRARTINAKQSVQKFINQKASGMRLPVEIGRFVSDTWSKVLIYTCVKTGDRSAEWQHQAKTLDDLLWCLQPLDNIDDMRARDDKVPGLLQALSDAMSGIQLPEAEVHKRLAEIETHLTNICANDQAYLEEDAPAPTNDSFEVMDEIILTLPGEQLDTATEVEVEPEFIDKIGKLREGSWVELRQPSGELLRCKLSAIIEPGGRYIFVNRRGMKVAERSRRGLAVELKRESLTILEESQVFDRALQAVIGNLRQMHRSPGNH